VAQAEAGFLYDETFGWNDRVGQRDGRVFPFEPELAEESSSVKFVVLPLAIMDTTLFRYAGLKADEALAVAVEVVEQTARAGGLLTLLWHNNFFDEAEYQGWQEVYVRLLDRIARSSPWCATGAEIAGFWGSREVQRSEHEDREA
jgi:hypothetical protein